MDTPTNKRATAAHVAPVRGGMKIDTGGWFTGIGPRFLHPRSRPQVPLRKFGPRFPARNRRPDPERREPVRFRNLAKMLRGSCEALRGSKNESKKQGHRESPRMGPPEKTPPREPGGEARKITAPAGLPGRATAERHRAGWPRARPPRWTGVDRPGHKGTGQDRAVIQEREHRPTEAVDIGPQKRHPHRTPEEKPPEK